jgi:hypothetical protein
MWSRMCNTIGKWSESSPVWYSYGPQYTAHLHFPQGSNELDTVALRFRIH